MNNRNKQETKDLCVLEHANWLVEQMTGEIEKYKHLHEVPALVRQQLLALPHVYLVRPLVLRALAIRATATRSSVAARYGIAHTWVGRIEEKC